MARRQKPKATYEDPLIIYGRVPFDLDKLMQKYTMNSKFGFFGKGDLTIGIGDRHGKTVIPLMHGSKYELRKYADRKLEEGTGCGKSSVPIE